MGLDKQTNRARVSPKKEKPLVKTPKFRLPFSLIDFIASTGRPKNEKFK